jgi:hypothetical protein
MRRLKLPVTIRIARPDEVPNNPIILKKIEDGKGANIEEGYVFHYNESHDLPFKFFAEINIDNDNLWSLFKTLLLQLPQEICLVFNHKDEEPIYSGYADKYEVINKLEQYEIELTQDGLLEFGALYNNKSFMEEIFIQSTKYLQYWGMDEERFKRTMTDFNLYEVPTLKFIDEFPIATEPLHFHNTQVKDTSVVLKQLAFIAR